MDTILDLLTDQRSNVTTRNDLGHFTNECKKSKQIKKDKDCLELEAKVSSYAKETARKGITLQKKNVGMILTMMMRAQNMQILL